MVIRARLVNKLLDGFLLHATCIVLFDRMPGHREAGKNNFPLWKAQVLSTLHGAEVSHFLDTATIAMLTKEIPKEEDKPNELIPNPEYAKWVAKDRQIFHYLISSMSRDVQV